MNAVETNGSETICAVASAPGSGAVGVIRLSGDRAHQLLQQLCGPRARKIEARRMHRRWIIDPANGDRLDEVLICWMPGPRSYTGEDVAEIYAHGGALHLEGLVTVLRRLGARAAEPGEFTRRAFLNGRIDLTRAEAVAEMIGARSERALRNARLTLAGELGHRVQSLRAATIDLAAELEASLDFAEDVEEVAAREQLLHEHQRLRDEVSALLATYAQGRRLDGVAVALVGAVNAGKSSLFNALLGRQRALVSEEAGTTRDYLEAEVSWEGMRVTLIDTAGERETAMMSSLERAGRALAAERLADCELRLLVVDAGSADALAVVEGRGESDGVTTVVLNKIDVVEPERLEQLRRRAVERVGRDGRVVLTSAATGAGLDELRGAVAERVVGEDQATLGDGKETVLVTQRRHVDALERARACYEEAVGSVSADAPPEIIVEHTRGALRALGEITGESFTEAVLDSVFMRFCIGK